ncbi:MAG TPA: lysophospholipid acyltransferase family protein [Terracidiphilus sp.]|nr:lysophospholipid acyltransferase family protein [Terracidiphilus sp.]
MSRPDPLPRLYRWRTNILQAPLFFFWTAFCGSLSLFMSLLEKSGRMQHRIARLWARGSVLISGARLTVRGAENLTKHPVAVYASNHTSYMDTPVIFATLPFQFRILARKELWGLPFIGWHLNRSGQLPIDTVNTHASLSSLGAGARALRAGMPLFVFPEGGRTQTGQLREFLSGAAFLAIRAQVPLVPIGLSGVYDLLPIHTRHFYPCPVTLAVGEPIDTKGMTIRQTEELTTRLRSAIAALRTDSTSAIPSLAASQSAPPFRGEP